MMEEQGRRRFFGRLSKLAAALGAVATGIVPELSKAQALPSNPAGGALAAAPPLAVEVENQLYMQALADADVALLMASLGGQMRLDPPSRSHDVVLDPQNRAATVMLPVVSYTTGAVAAYICFGAGTSPQPDGSPVTMPIRGMVAATGEVSIAGGGRIAASPKPEFDEAIFASLFPEVYFETRVNTGTASSPLRRRTSGAIWNNRLMRRVAVALDRRGMCMRNCNISWQTCLNTPLVSTATGAVVGFWCMICLGLATGATIITIGAGAPTLAACLTPCAISAAALTAAAITLANCNSAARQCFELCEQIPPGQPI